MQKKLAGWGLALCAVALVLSFGFSVMAENQSNKLSPDNLWQKEKKNIAPVSDQIVIKKTDGSLIKMKVANTTFTDKILASWQRMPGIEYAEVDGLAWALGQQTSWGYDTVKAAAATTTNSATGNGIVVAVIDTGVDYNHEDLSNNIWVNTDEIPGNNLDDDANGYIDDTKGYDFIGNIYTEVHPDNDPDDDYGHGTHVSGIIAAADNALGIKGVAPLAKIMPVKVLDSSGYGWSSDIATGIYYAVNNGAKIINMSLGSSLPSATLKNAVDYAVANNVLVVAAAGNSSSYTYSLYPASYDNVVSVAASNEDGYKAYFSNWGKVDITAPGDSILSSLPGNKYASWSGTSMASPFVAGVAALIEQTKGISNISAVRHILQSTAADFGTQVGPDYVTGQGMVDALAATGTLSAKTTLYSDSGYIKADNADDAIIYASVRDASGNALNAETVNWFTTKGTLSAASSTTNAKGIASITLTANNTSGLAQITATPVNATAGSMQMAISNTAVVPDSVGITKTTTATESTTDPATTPEVTPTTLSNNLFTVGDQLTIWSYGTAYDKAEHTKVTMTYAVTDPNGTAVVGMSGTTEQVQVGYDYGDGYFSPQSRFNSVPLTIPADAIDGQYTVNVTLTDIATGKTSAAATTFWINTMPKVLVVYNTDWCWDTSLVGMDNGYMTTCDNTGLSISNTLTALNYDVMLWDTTEIGYPASTDLSFFPVVVWADAGLSGADSTTLQSYLDNGGNLLLTSEVFGAMNSYSGANNFMWNYLHASYANNELMMPDKVAGTTGGLFNGLDFNIDYYDQNGNGTHDSYYADELQLNTADNAAAIFNYHIGKSANKVAGVMVDNGTFRSVYLSFGLEAINDASTGNATKTYVLGSLVDWLLGDGPAITSVSPNKIYNNKDKTITVTGSGFSKLGTTTIKLDDNELTNVVVTSRNTITANVPLGLAKNKYTLTVINPDGATSSLAEAVQIKKGGAAITSVTPSLIANHRDQKVVITGYNFKKKSKVFVGKKRIHDITLDNSAQLTITIAKDWKLGKFTIKIKNPNQVVGKMKHAIQVRYGFDKEYKNGDTNTGVLALEKRLKKYGYFTDEADTTFNNKTKEAILLYQQNYNLTANGQLDFATRYSLNTIE